jgi:hypothetical protein
MLKLKNVWLFLLGIILTFWLNFQFTNWLCLERDHCNEWKWSQWDERPSDPKMSGETISETDPIWSGSKVMWDKSVWILHLPQVTNYDTELWYLLALIKIIINRILWILAFIALIYMLYCWFLVLSSWSDDKNASKGKKWIKTAAVAIAWIWLAWLIISAMIWFIKVITKAS